MTTDTVYDVVIIGAGPAGVQAAIHSARRKIKVLMLGRIENSALYTAHIENYAYVDGVSNGSELLQIGVKQAITFGAEVSPEDVLKIEHLENELFCVKLETGRTINTRTLIFSMGVSKKKLNVPGEKDLSGKGVSYCVDCDANFYRGAVVAVTGDRSAAVDGALTLLDYASDVYLIGNKLDVSSELKQRLDTSKVKRIKSDIKEIQGKFAVNSILLENGEQVNTEGVFIELGSKGALELATQVGVLLDTESFKYIQTDRKQATNIAGIYAAGDIVGPPYQMAKAVGEGCVAGMEAATFVRKQKAKQE